MANETIQRLIEDLGGNWRQRRGARDTLRRWGRLRSQTAAARGCADDQVRWEALKILSERLDPALAAVFVEALAPRAQRRQPQVASHAYGIWVGRPCARSWKVWCRGPILLSP